MAITEDEALTVGKLLDLDWATAPVEAQLNVPAWAVSGLKERFGDDFAVAMASFLRSAPLDVRINALKNVDFDLSKNINVSAKYIEKNRYSQFGYRIATRVNLGAEKAYRDGLVEIQDEAAQVASALVAAQPGHQVIDQCAGGGGKSLAVAADMTNRGQIHAFDISGKRLANFRARIQRAGARNIQVTRIAPQGEGRKTAINGLQGKADRVLVDVPCTGTGTWRRNPDQRWRYNNKALAELNVQQADLLREGGALVKVGGWLVYMTCSVLPSENEHIVQSFIEQSKDDWQLLDYRDVWRKVFDGNRPDTSALELKCLQLVPHIHDTDGFFIAILERQ
ncbi:RsmB/NOP family class I SAM-dependent RNA methyltransferase [Kordiimonas sp.]|uniref:RsmB/NOP family class I SAM-dependent RNA methyltransferase n=1 Tax=Kordiimonas sp. TaxID=1970157 RepID=UPI003A8EE4AF